MLGYIGFLMTMIGAAGVGGNKPLIAGTICVIGLKLITSMVQKENSSAPSRPK